ncbi:hypothetical protein PAPYR_6029 [Paratrimastix pyriformis]|uniref:Uncharacterized protein n=1 Tax=Paratrimastix pyriformis TaxID=342808 RepID=A0ABQ8UG35_9EUKA|nr:hypothetical protein PAPYR_6029 [Paratrimastix pyriformis]
MPTHNSHTQQPDLLDMPTTCPPVPAAARSSASPQGSCKTSQIFIVFRVPPHVQTIGIIGTLAARTHPKNIPNLTGT